MNLIFRLIAVLIGAFRRPRLGPFDTSVLRFRVLPNDLDTNLHMNNGRYLAVMDLGRTDLVIRLGVVPELMRRRWNPVVGALTIRFRRSLSPFQPYELHTRVLCWNDKWFFMERWFEVAGERMARGIVKATFLGPEPRVSPQQIVDASGQGAVSPPIPAAIQAWMAAEETM